MFATLMMSVALMSDPAQEPATPRLWTAGEVTFLARPQPEFPTLARSGRGEAWLTCTVTARGTFRSCQIESESPQGNGFGRAAVVSMQRGARIEMGEGGPAEGDRLRASILFWNGL